MIDILGYCAAFLTTASFLPQAIKTIKTKDTSGISLLMYLMFTVGVLAWLIYGTYRMDVPVIIGNAVTLGFAITILRMKIKYK